jgi:hypothetical protein
LKVKFLHHHHFTENNLNYKNLTSAFKRPAEKVHHK